MAKIRGGFYTAGNKLWHPLFLTEYSEKNIFASIDYRLVRAKDNTIHAREMLSDVRDALLKIREIAGENGIAVSDFVLAGHSAGAHLALLYGYKFFEENSARGINVAVCVGLSGPSDYTDDFGWSSMPYYGADLQTRLAALSWIGTELTGAGIKLTRYNWMAQNDYSEFKKHAEEISPVIYARNAKKLPATLLVHGLDDRIVPYSNSLKLNAALDGTSTTHKLITVTGTGNNHMLGGTSGDTRSVKPITYKNQPWIDEAKEWLTAYLD